MAEGPGHGQTFQKVVTLGIFFPAAGVPALHKFLYLRQQCFRQGNHLMVRVFGAEVVEMVALALEFPTPQVGQLVDVIDIVKGVPVGAEQESAGEQGFQLFFIGMCDAGNAAGDAPVPGILNDDLDEGLLVSGADGIGIDAVSMEMGEKGGAVRRQSNLLMAPQKQVGKGIFAAPLRTGEEQCVVLVPQIRTQTDKIDHGSHSFVGSLP